MELPASAALQVRSLVFQSTKNLGGTPFKIIYAKEPGWDLSADSASRWELQGLEQVLAQVAVAALPGELAGFRRVTPKDNSMVLTPVQDMEILQENNGPQKERKETDATQSLYKLQN